MIYVYIPIMCMYMYIYTSGVWAMVPPCFRHYSSLAMVDKMWHSTDMGCSLPTFDHGIYVMHPNYYLYKRDHHHHDYLYDDCAKKILLDKTYNNYHHYTSPEKRDSAFTAGPPPDCCSAIQRLSWRPRSASCSASNAADGAQKASEMENSWDVQLVHTMSMGAKISVCKYISIYLYVHQSSNVHIYIYNIYIYTSIYIYI